jgi:hypothetical protein
MILFSFPLPTRNQGFPASFDQGQFFVLIRPIGDSPEKLLAAMKIRDAIPKLGKRNTG